MSVLHTILSHCDRLIASQSGTEWLRDEIGKIRDLARDGIAETHSVTSPPTASASDVARQSVVSEPQE